MSPPIASSDPNLVFVRLSKVSLPTLVEHMSDPRVARHMPLLSEPWDTEAAHRFVVAKEASWRRDGLGHWAILAGGHYVGWGGFQKEGEAWDFGLVLRPAAFGLGLEITRVALDFARADPCIPYITFLLPTSRRNLGALARIGAQPLGEVLHENVRFRKFRLDTPCPGTLLSRPNRKDKP